MIKPDPIREVLHGRRVFLFYGLTIFVLWVGLGSVRISTQFNGKCDCWAVSYDIFRELTIK